MDAPWTSLLRANSMASAGMDVTVIGFPREYPAHGRDCHFAYRSLLEMQTPGTQESWARWKERLGNYWTFVVEPFLLKRTALKLARQEAYDVVYITDVETWILLTLLLFQRHSKTAVPVSATIPHVYYQRSGSEGRSLSSRFRGLLNRGATRFLPGRAHVIFPDPHVQESLRVKQGRRTHIISEGFAHDRKAPSRQEARMALGIRPDLRMVMLFGAASRVKGADFVVKALENVPPELLVYFVGQTGGVYEESWGSIDTLERLGWKGLIYQIDQWVSEEDLDRYFAACDAVILPYRKGFATISGNLRQAVEFSRPMVASDQFTIGDLVRTYKLGLLFPPEDTDALADRLRELSSKPDEWFEEIGRNAAALARKMSWIEIGREYRNLFEQMAGTN